MIGQYGLSIGPVNPSGSRVTGSLPWGSGGQLPAAHAAPGSGPASSAIAIVAAVMTSSVRLGIVASFVRCGPPSSGAAEPQLKGAPVRFSEGSARRGMMACPDGRGGAVRILVVEDE